VLLRHPTMTLLLHRWVGMPRLEPEDAIAFLQDVELRFARSRQPRARVYVAWALCHRGGHLEEMGRTDEAIAAWEEVFQRFGDPDVPALRWWVAKAMVLEAVTLQRTGRAEDALAGYAEVERRVVDETAGMAAGGLPCCSGRTQGP
jgi:hypothetical protein